MHPIGAHDEVSTIDRMPTLSSKELLFSYTLDD